ncbi:MAG: PAS domain-containing protein [Candidatus Limnocylindrales bacterium]
MTDGEEPIGSTGSLESTGDLGSQPALVRMALRISRLGAWQVDVGTRAMAWSDEVRAIHGVPPGITPTLDEAMAFYASDDRSTIYAAFARCVEAGTPFDLELRIITASGPVVWVRAIGEAVRDETGAITRIQGAFQDISAQKEAEHRERTLTDRLTSTLGAMSDAFFTLDRSWRFSFVNDAAEELLLRSREALIGTNIWEAFPEAAGTISETAYRRAMDERLPSRFEAHYPPLNEWFEASAYPAIEGIAVYFRSITDRVQADVALRESEERFRLLSQATSDAIWDWDLVTDSLWWSDGMESLFGHRRVDLPADSSSWSSQIHPDDRGAVLASIRAVIDGDGTDWEADYRFQRRDGSYARVVDTGYVIRDADGRSVRMIGGMSDITERHRLEAELQQAQRLEAIGQLVGGVAHDFNNLLTVIIGNSELLAMDLAGEPDRQSLATTVLSAAQRAAELTQRLLAFARRQALAPRAVDVHRLIDEMDSLLRRTLGEQVEIGIVARPGLWSALVDPAQLEGAILNLAINARDAMEAGGRLTIETANVVVDEASAEQHVDASPGSFVVIAVSDTGSGIAPEHIGQVFDPFFTTKPAGRGTGLGLSMVYGFVKQSGGHARIYSEVGHGTTVRLYLPRASDEEEVPERVTTDAVRGGNETVLLVEDDHLVRSYATESLMALGYRVVAAANGPEALGRLREHDDIALLFTDVIMPGGMNGRQLADAILATRPATRVLFTSGYAEDAIVHHGRLDAGVRLLAKPYRRADLARAVRSALDG